MKRNQNLKRKLFLLGSVPLLLSLAQPASALSVGKAAEGVEFYRQKDFEKAQENFLEASEKKPGDPKLSYNLGNSRYKLGKFGDALQDYSRSAEKPSDPALQQSAVYNMGNALYRMGNLEEAAAAYKKSLEMNPNDTDAKFNLEFVREQIEKKKQEQKQKQKQKQKQEDPKDKNKQDPEKDNSGKADQQDNPDDPSKGSQKPSPFDQRKQEGEQPSRQAETPGMTPEDAEQRLSSLTEDIKKFQRKQALNMESLFNYQGNDW